MKERKKKKIPVLSNFYQKFDLYLLFLTGCLKTKGFPNISTRHNIFVDRSFFIILAKADVSPLYPPLRKRQEPVGFLKQNKSIAAKRTAAQSNDYIIFEPQL